MREVAGVFGESEAVMMGAVEDARPELEAEGSVKVLSLEQSRYAQIRFRAVSRIGPRSTT